MCLRKLAWRGRHAPALLCNNRVTPRLLPLNPLLAHPADATCPSHAHAAPEGPGSGAYGKGSSAAVRVPGENGQLLREV